MAVFLRRIAAAKTVSAIIKITKQTVIHNKKLLTLETSKAPKHAFVTLGVIKVNNLVTTLSLVLQMMTYRRETRF